jgi:copper chaperone
MTSMTYQVTGMTCEHCTRAVTEEIESLDGVSAVAVSLVPGGISAVTVTSDAPLAPEAVMTALDEAGAYSLSGAGDDAGAGAGAGDVTHAAMAAPGRTLPLM